MSDEGAAGGAVAERFAEGFGGDVDHFRDAVDPVTHDPFDPGLQRLGRRRAPDARSGELDFDDAGVFVDRVQDDVAPIGLESRADHFDGGLDLCTHLDGHSISAARTILVVTVALAAALLAHEGGWDEALLIGGPIVAIAGLLLLAKKRVDAAAAELASDADPTD